MDKLRLGIFGFGTVAQGLYERLQQEPQSGISLEKVCVRDPKKHKNKLPSHLLTSDLEEILQSPNIDVLVELTDDPKASYQAYLAAQRAKKAFVSANKRMLAYHIEEIHASKVPVLYEASTGGAIPIFQSIETCYQHAQIHGLTAILNGSSHYVLSEWQRTGGSIAQILRKAQDCGIAESDATLDMEGHDAQFKLKLLLWHLFRQFVPLSDIHRVGISHLSDNFLHYASARNSTIKPLAVATTEEKSLFACVSPFLVPLSLPFAQLSGASNHILLQTDSGAHALTGLGAGKVPTALAIWSDLMALKTKWQGYSIKPIAERLKWTINAPKKGLKVCIEARTPEAQAELQKYSTLRLEEDTFYTGRLPFSSMKVLQTRHDLSVLPVLEPISPE